MVLCTQRKGWCGVSGNLEEASQVKGTNICKITGKEALGFVEKSKWLQGMKSGCTQRLLRRKER